jgi:ERCC4-type nuclease
MAEPWEKEAARLEKLARPAIVVDTREQTPFVFSKMPSERGTLATGDYSLRGLTDWIVFERKSLGDLCGTLTVGRERFMREVERMMGFRWRGLVLECERCQVEAAAYRSRVAPQSLLSTLDALMVRANLHVIWTPGAQDAAERVENVFRLFVRGVCKDLARGRYDATDAAAVRAALGLE